MTKNNSQTEPFSELFPETKAVQVLGVSRNTLLRLRNSGAIRFYRIGQRVFYSAAHLAEFCASVEQNVPTQSQGILPVKPSEQLPSDELKQPGSEEIRESSSAIAA